MKQMEKRTKMQWHVTLPQGKQLWLESDTPREDLKRLGYCEYALTDVRIIPKGKLPRKNKWIRL